eukprot:TRINITY_DN4655_c0_g1_i3.p1 TRINITY_DN4655_c0_g1~~TRINITY_DN4655_c0_g1_i3.p1  ORF type:complete len:458 (-),score=118.47 TRINITY_DN4655_c0_g1_i3:2-1375(-)
MAPETDFNLGTIIKDINNPDPQTWVEATVNIRKLLSKKDNPPIQQIIDAKIVPRLVDFLKVNDFQLQFEAAWALTNIASGNSQQVISVVESQAVPIFLSLLSSPNDDVAEQVVWAIGNIAGDSSFLRDYVLSLHALPALVKLLWESPRLSMLRNGTWALSNLCRGKPGPKWELVRPAMELLAHLVYSADEEVLADACWALSYLSDSTNESIQAIIDMKIHEKVVKLLGHESTLVQSPALRTVGNIATGDDNQTQAIIDAGAVPLLNNLLSSTHKGIRRETCWTISNIAAGNQAQIQSLLDHDVFSPLIDILDVGEYDVRKEAIWAIANATSHGTKDQIEKLVAAGCIRSLCEMLDGPDPKTTLVVLEGLDKILKIGQIIADETNTDNEFVYEVEEAEGLDKIEDLQTHDNEEIYEKAIKMIEKYFREEEENIAPNGAMEAEGATYQFGSEQMGNFKF